MALSGRMSPCGSRLRLGSSRKPKACNRSVGPAGIGAAKCAGIICLKGHRAILRTQSACSNRHQSKIQSMKHYDVLGSASCTVSSRVRS